MVEIPTDRLSLVVGVTGHRDIAAADEAPLRAAFGGVLRALAQACPHTPLLVLSGLAAGADSIAAEEALAQQIPVVGCLPMPVAEYEKDFSPEGLARFHTLLAACSRVAITSPTRERGYVATGRFIAQYSHLLVAFWDERSSRGAGGTADVIAMRMTGRPSSIEDIPYLPDVGPVDVIVTPRAGEPPPADPFTVKRCYPRAFDPGQSPAKSFEAILERIDTYNADLEQVPTVPGEPPEEALMERTDEAANRLQGRTKFFERLLFGIAFLTAAVQIVVHFIPPLWKVIGLALAFAAYRVARRHDYENRYQDYRAVAEGLRVQNAWFCAGVRHRLVDNEYLRMQEGELQWIRMTLRFFYLLNCENREHPDASFMHPVCRDWVRSQWRYYYRMSRRQTAARRWLRQITVAVFALGVACFAFAAIVLGKNFPCAFLSVSCHLAMPPSEFELLQNFLSVPIALAAIVAAIFAHYEEKENLQGNARRYERMFAVFSRARRDLAAIARGAPDDSRKVIYELGRAALIEHADWLIMRRDRPMKVVMV